MNRRIDVVVSLPNPRFRLPSLPRALCTPPMTVLVTLVGLLLLTACGSDRDSQRSQIQPDPTSTDRCASAPIDGFGFDTYGGWKGVQSAATGRFRVERVDGVWWFITPEGHGLFSNGPTGIDFVGDFIGGTSRSPYRDTNLTKHGSASAWAAATMDRLCDLGIRTIGGWVGPDDLDLFQGQIAYAVNVDFYEAMPRLRTGPATLKARRDVFDPAAAELAQALAADGGMVARCAADPWCIGAYVENEAPYAPSLLAGGGHLEAYLSQAPQAPSKLALQDFFTTRYAGRIDEFNAVWGTTLNSFDDLQQRYAIGSCAPLFGFEDDVCYLGESRKRIEDRYAFEAHVAGRIAELADAVLDGANPQMLNLGPRIVVSAFAPEVLRALAAHADVMSVNNYDVEDYAGEILAPAYHAALAELDMLSFDPFARLEQIARITDKPVLITEWFYRRARPGVSTFPPFLPEVADGAAQAEAYRRYVEAILEMPFIVGHHWFQWVDQPIEGRGDGENQLIGIVDIDDELNQPLAATVAELNSVTIASRLRLRP